MGTGAVLQISNISPVIYVEIGQQVERVKMASENLFFCTPKKCLVFHLFISSTQNLACVIIVK